MNATFLGAFLIWSGSGQGMEQYAQPGASASPRVSKRQETYNVAVGLVGGAASLVLGVVLIGVGLTR